MCVSSLRKRSHAKCVTLASGHANLHKRKLVTLLGCSVKRFFPTSLCGVLVFDSVSRSRSRSRPRPPRVRSAHLCHTPSFTHTIFVTHHLSHTTLSHTLFHTHTHHLSHSLSHTPSFTHNFVTHHLCHTPSFTHTIFHTLFHTHHLSHTTLSHTIFVTHHLSHTPSFTQTQLCHTPSFTHNFVTHHLCHTPSFTHTIFHTHNFVTHPLSHTTLSHTLFHKQLSQLWHIPLFTHHLSHTTYTHHLSHTHNFVTHSLSHTIFHTHTPSFTHNFVTHNLSHTHTQLCVAGKALRVLDVPFAWQACRLVTFPFHLRGRHGTCCTWLALGSPLVFRGAAPLCLAGVALGDIDVPFAWQAWLVTATCVWQAWHLLQSADSGGRAWSPLVAQGAAPLCMAGVALVALGWLWWRAWSPLVARGAAPLCVTGVAFGDIDVPFAWQAWHFVTLTFHLRGRRGTCCTWLALVARLVAVSGPGRRATLRGWRGT